MADELDIPQQSPRAFDVGATPNGPNPLGGAGAPPPTAGAPAPSPVRPPAPNPAAADVAHHYSLGRAVKSLFGTERNYSVDPATGKMSEEETQAKPGQIFRHMVAGVMLGGAAAEKGKAKSFLGGAAQGGAAVVEHDEAQDKIKQDSARKDFEQGLQAKRENREEQQSNTQQDLMRAQIAMHNAQTLRENQLTQHENFKMHEETASSGKTQIQPYLDAGASKIYSEVSESDMNEILKSNPNAVHLLWEPTGTTTGTGPDGKPTHELTYSAVDPKGKVKVTDANIKQWKQAGLDKIYGSSFETLKSGKELPVNEYMAITHAEQEQHNKNQIRGKQKLDEDKEKAEIVEKHAQAAHLLAESSKLKRDNKKDSDYDSALEELNNPVSPAKKGDKPGVGGDFSKLSPKSKFILGDHITKETDELAKMHKQLVDAGQGGSDEAKALYKKWETLNSVKGDMISPPKTGAAPQGGMPQLNDAGKQLVQSFSDSTGQPFMPKERAGDSIWSSDLPPDQKLAATKAYGAVMPWKSVEEFSAKVGIKPDDGAAQLKAAGINVGGKPASAPSGSTGEDGTLD